jgi:mRNA interferase HigB
MWRVHVISRKKLQDFWESHADAREALLAWHADAEKATWRHLDDVRQTYSATDAVGRWTVFNIRGNRYRLIVSIHYNRQKIYIRHVLTHAEYDRGDWKRDE